MGQQGNSDFRKHRSIWRQSSMVLFLLAATAILAQLPTVTILGLVKDASGAVVPGATLTAQSQTNPPSEAGSHLNEQESRGQGWFMQRCALCHLPKLVKPYKSSGPSLTGVLKGAKANNEPVVRQLILKGSPNMPGFEYGLTKPEIDDVIAYLKTLGV